MSLSDRPYVEPRGEPAPEAGGAAPVVPPDTLLDLGPAPDFPPLAGKRSPEPIAVEDVVSLLQQLATREREIFSEELAGMYQRIDLRLEDALARFQDPSTMLRWGIVFGGVGVLIALVVLLAIGVLFLHGLTLIRGFN